VCPLGSRNAVWREACLALLEAALGPDPVDPEEVRRELIAARRLGLDWRSLYDEVRARRPPHWPPAPEIELESES
jgi:hypothetical protein